MPVIVAVARVVRLALDAALVLLIAVVLATLVIARVLPAITGGTTFAVGGGSMAPAIPIGAAVMPVPVDPATLRLGDVVTVRAGPEHALFTHRITRLVERDGGLWLATRGDANDRPDPSLVPATTVVGRVDFMIPYAGYAVALLSTMSGVVLLLSVAGFMLAGAWLLETVEEERPMRRESRRPPMRPARRIARHRIGRRSPAAAMATEPAAGGGAGVC